MARDVLVSQMWKVCSIGGEAIVSPVRKYMETMNSPSSTLGQANVPIRNVLNVLITLIRLGEALASGTWTPATHAPCLLPAISCRCNALALNLVSVTTQNSLEVKKLNVEMKQVQI